jgi:hypothetical protein
MVGDVGNLQSNNGADYFKRVPKELISRFVKICPTCQTRRGALQMTHSRSRRVSPCNGKVRQADTGSISCLSGERYSHRGPEFADRAGVVPRLDGHGRRKMNVSTSLPDLNHSFHVNSQPLSSLSLQQSLGPYDGGVFIHTTRGISDPANTLLNGYNVACVGHNKSHYDY